MKVGRWPNESTPVQQFSPTALFTVNLSGLHYHIIQYVYDVISDSFDFSAENSLASSLDDTVMQMRKGNHDGAIAFYVRLPGTVKSANVIKLISVFIIFVILITRLLS